MFVTFNSMNTWETIRKELKLFFEELHIKNNALLFVALNEAVNNAIFHGSIDNTTMPTITISIERESNQLTMSVTHNGIGIDPKLVSDMKPADHYLDDHGRGLDIIKLSTDSFWYNETGNEIVMVKNL